MQSGSVDKNLKDFEALLEKCTLLNHIDKNNPEALSQLYKMMNYKPTTNKGEKLSTEQVANFLKPATTSVEMKSAAINSATFFQFRHARRLQTEQPLPDLTLGGDVVMVPANIDSSYTAYLGANGTTVSVPPDSKPINITSEFP